MNLQGPQTELLLSTMQEQNVRISSSRIAGLEVLDVSREHTVQLQVCFERDSIPAKKSQIPKPAVVHQWPHLQCLADKLMPYDTTLQISLLIGSNCPRVYRPREIIEGGEDDPCGQRSLLGWGSNRHFVYGSKVKEVLNPENVLKVRASDFVENHQEKPYSVEDEKFLNVMEIRIKKTSDGHYQMSLPLKSNAATLPNNCQLAVKRWNRLSARFRRNGMFRDNYQGFMEDVISNCAERVSLDQLDVEEGRVNYVPHTGVCHPKKPDKIRVVFGKEEVSFMVDVKGMFHQFCVEEKFCNLLRFLWWENGDPEKPVGDYRMKVHLFGAASSPGCANFGLKRAADDREDEFSTEAANFIRNDLHVYVDDGLKSLPTVEKAASLIKASQNLCANAGLMLHKIISSKQEL
ncbi:uncharacterized protein LOC110978578 [Acanthaster planci]|uniref:Uncharacterized protein LOC110978578 n=1 Tax=Acanthaster planci TaxID=133434 RepID=A0A8B7YAG8_ACAPL|nr:uncharacterized protein LOC110978578 [Acanthaster planci]